MRKSLVLVPILLALGIFPAFAQEILRAVLIRPTETEKRSDYSTLWSEKSDPTYSLEISPYITDD